MCNVRWLFRTGLSSLQHSSWMYVTIKHTTGLILPTLNSHRWQLWSLFVCLVILCHLSAFIYVVFSFVYFEIKAVFSIKRALRCFSPSYGSVSFSLTVAMVLWLNQELVYWPKSDRKRQKTTRVHVQLTFHSSFCPAQGSNCGSFRRKALNKCSRSARLGSAPPQMRSVGKYRS